ncbi:hypothetical protein OF83DRAFT_1052715 [Amylostereum chailletii]|nr:hypothetical protein OF83DRAFT_1052715 [Amylostereum chailletii]
MSFRARNAYYLRISASSVLPLYVYLDERHITWMSDSILQHVLEDLRPKIIPKLRAEAGAYHGSIPAPTTVKKGTVDVHRGETYQFAYFFRHTEPHSVLVKTRNFVLDTTPHPVRLPPPPPSSSGTKRKKPVVSQKRTTSRGSKKRKSSKRTLAQDEEEEAMLSDEEFNSTSVPSAPRRSTRTRKAAGAYREMDVDDEIPLYNGQDTDMAVVAEDEPPDISTEIAVKDEAEEPNLSDIPIPQDIAQKAHQTVIEIDDEEPKPKLALQLKFQGFSVQGRSLCVVVEPWPPMRGASRTPSLAPSSTGRASSIAPPDFVPSTLGPTRARTPLFLPDYDREGSEAPMPMRLSTLPPVPLFNDPPPDGDDDLYGDDTGMMDFSQVLNSTGKVARGVDDDDEFEGAVLFADADEAREL